MPSLNDRLTDRTIVANRAVGYVSLGYVGLWPRSSSSCCRSGDLRVHRVLRRRRVRFHSPFPVPRHCDNRNRPRSVPLPCSLSSEGDTPERYSSSPIETACSRTGREMARSFSILAVPFFKMTVPFVEACGAKARRRWSHGGTEEQRRVIL